jgi:hypothetical protein
MLRASGYLGYLTPSDTSTGKIDHILLQKHLPVMICPVSKKNIPICQRNIKSRSSNIEERLLIIWQLMTEAVY